MRKKSTALPGERARAFAKRYTDVAEALIQQGVEERLAREEARLAATLVYLMPDNATPGVVCPTCGRIVE